jgi:hypothetical protein
MNVGIDIDATITETPEIFALLSHALREAGHRVYVVSFRDQDGLDESRAEVDKYGISYDDIFHPQDHEDIPQFKARMARELELDIFFDDMPEAFTQMPPKVKRFWLCDPEVYDLKRMIDALGPGMLKFGDGDE